MTLFDEYFYEGASDEDFEHPLKTPRIGYSNLLPDSTVVASTSEAGFPVSALLNPLTYEFWKPTSFPAEVTVDTGNSAPVGYIGLAAHNLCGCRVSVLYSVDDGLNYEPAVSFELKNNNPVMVLFPEVNAQLWRVTIEGWAFAPVFSANFVDQEYGVAAYDSADAGDSRVGVMYLGKPLAMPYPIYGGHAPGVLSRNTLVQPNRSEGGQWLGRSVIRNGASADFDFNNLRAAWYRENFDPFVASAIEAPYFIGWRPRSYPGEVLYATTDADISPVNTGVADRMSVQFTAQGVGANV